jgi:cytoskeletal protein RodZ
MSNKEVRELQFTRMQLVIVFVLVIALGAFIFVLGVAVGKKQARLAQGLESASSPAAEVVRPRVKPPAAGKESTQTPDESKTPGAKTAKKSPGASDIQKEIASFQVREKPSTSAGTTAGSKPTVKKETQPAQEKKPAPAATALKAEAPPAGLLYIQVVAARQKEEASALADTITKLGFTVVVLEPQGGVPFYRVRVGGYRTEEERNRAGQALASALKKTPGDFYYPPR